MQTRSILTALPPILAAALSGCGPVDPVGDIPEQASYCAIDFVEDFSETRAVELGLGPPADFEPIADGDEIDTIVGGQGATMITPVVRVQKGPDDDPEPCFRVRVEEIESGYSSEWGIRFRADGGHHFSDGALYFITYSKGPVELALTVQGKGFSGTNSVSVVLR